MAEIAHQREPLGTVAVELRRIDDAARAIFLRHIHRHIGALDEHFGFRSVLRGDRNADAPVHVEVQPFNRERLLYRGDELPRRELGALPPYAGHHDGELVAAEPRDRVRFAHPALQPMPDFAEHRVAHQVPHGVVDLLESIEIHDQHRQRTFRAQGVGHRHLEPVLKQRPVREIGQAVVVGEVTDALFRLGSLAPHLRVAQLAVDRWNQTAQVVLDDVIVGAVFHRIDGDLFADRSRHENERQLEAAIPHHATSAAVPLKPGIV